MCNIDKYECTIEDIDFDLHRHREHKVQNYVYLIPYLLNKNPQEYSRAESYVWREINLKKAKIVRGPAITVG